MSKLAALLNMLASDNDGERANASAMIARMAAKENKTVSDFVMSPQTIYRDRIVEKTVYRDRPQPDVRQAQAQRRGLDEDDLRNYRPKQSTRRGRGNNPILDGLREAQDRPDILTGWEMEFIESVLMQCMSDGDLSWRQERTANKIKVKLDLYDDPLV